MYRSKQIEIWQGDAEGAPSGTLEMKQSSKVICFVTLSSSVPFLGLVDEL
jgi:hypothetical protein